MKTIFLIFTLLFSLFTIGQKKTNSSAVHTKTVKEKDIKLFIDSLKNKIFADTVKFNTEDLIYSDITRNSKTYSSLFIVDKNNRYKLDIITGRLVKEFVTELLNPSKILSIDVIDNYYSQALFGVYGINETISIITKKNSKPNYSVGGLRRLDKSKTANNFDQRHKGKIYLNTRR